MALIDREGGEGMDGDVDIRFWKLVRLRRQVEAMREDASYWRTRGRHDTAAEVERIVAHMEDVIRDLERTLAAIRKTPPA
jgi:hypothetical protein